MLMHVVPALLAAFPHGESWLKAELLRDKTLTQQSTWQPWRGSICKAVVNPWGWVRKLLENDVLAGDVPSGAQNPAAPAGCLGDLDLVAKSPHLWNQTSQGMTAMKPEHSSCPCIEDLFPMLPVWAAQECSLDKAIGNLCSPAQRGWAGFYNPSWPSG